MEVEREIASGFGVLFIVDASLLAPFPFVSFANETVFFSPPAPNFEGVLGFVFPAGLGPIPNPLGIETLCVNPPLLDSPLEFPPTRAGTGEPSCFESPFVIPLAVLARNEEAAEEDEDGREEGEESESGGCDDGEGWKRRIYPNEMRARGSERSMTKAKTSYDEPQTLQGNRFPRIQASDNTHGRRFDLASPQLRAATIQIPDTDSATISLRRSKDVGR